MDTICQIEEDIQTEKLEFIGGEEKYIYHFITLTPKWIFNYFFIHSFPFLETKNILFWVNEETKEKNASS